MAPSRTVSKLVFRFKMGMARRFVGRKSVKILTKVFVGDQGVEVINKLYELCRILVGGDQKEANYFIDRSLRILTDCGMLSLQAKFTEEETASFVIRVNSEIGRYNRIFEVMEEKSPGFNTVEIPTLETEYQRTFKKLSEEFISNLTIIFIESFGQHFDPGTIRCIHKISSQLCTDRTLNQLCYTKSPATLQLADIVETASRCGLERRITANFEALCFESEESSVKSK